MDSVDKPSNTDLEQARRALARMRERLSGRLTPEYLAELRRQAVLLKDAPEEREALEFIEAIVDTEGWDAIIDEI